MVRDDCMSTGWSMNLTDKRYLALSGFYSDSVFDIHAYL